MLYTKDTYLDKTIPYIVSAEIIEYDISSAGFNLCKRYKLLTEKQISFLESLEKKSRQIQLGLMCRRDSKLNEALKSKFIAIRKEFFEANGIKDDEVLSIKKDAIFMLRRCNILEFDNVVFKEKHIYTSYYYLNGKEFYVGDSIDVKGINDSVLEPHKDYMLDFLYKFFKMVETSPRQSVVRELVGFIDAYKSGNLELGYYRELNEHSMYRINKNLTGFPVMMEDVTNLDIIDIGYNYQRYIVPLISILI